MTKFSFGSDPEFILKRNGRYFSAIGVIPGTKEKRHKIGGNSYYYDNVLAECTIQPAFSEDEAVENVRTALSNFVQLADPYKLMPQASQEFPKEELNHPDAVAIGCKREICAYALTDVEPPEETMLSSPLRSAGGHVHIGSEFAKDGFGCLHTIRMMDLLVGIPSIFLDHDKTTKERKKLYGQAGRFRRPKHGAEYRSMGNFWLSSPKTTRLIYRLCAATMQFVEDGGHNELWFIDHKKLEDDASWNDLEFNPASCHICKGYDLKTLRTAIDNVDEREANKLIPLVQKILGAKLFSEYEELAQETTQYDMYREWELHA
jgi:hypothetical protein